MIRWCCYNCKYWHGKGKQFMCPTRMTIVNEDDYFEECYEGK